MFTPNEEPADVNGCGDSQKDDDQDGVMNDADQCPDTTIGFPVDSDGCIDETALDTDLDGDGWKGNYSFTVNSTTGLRENQIGDAFPLDATQWHDKDGDGYGDNLVGENADECPEEHGLSFEDFLGCYDDGDGWRDQFEPVSLRDNPTQWEDRDTDGYGDNASGTNPDLCPGVDGYSDGCPKEKVTDTGSSSTIMGISKMAFIGIIGGSITLLVIIVIVLRLVRGDDDYDFDEDDEDWYDDDDDDDEDDFMSSLRSSPKKSPARSLPSRGDDRPAAKPPSRGPSGKPTSGRGPPGKATPSRVHPGSNTGKVSSKTNVDSTDSADENEEGQVVKKKKRKATMRVDLSIFESHQTADRESAANWVKQALSDGEEQRTIMMQLQETGWTAQQSRAIFDLGRSR
ncbi:MAG: hypothetical protein CXT70_04835 [Methanobacteriota archaeon]|nr:MAG: hypothetical protein CXT70_04835 [Euryarchaeota archaeon]